MKLLQDISISDLGNSIHIDNADIILDLNSKNLTSGSSDTNNLQITNGTITLTGDGNITTNDKYDSKHSTTVISAKENGNLILDGVNINTVMNDAVNEGQFGVGVYDNGNITIENADIKSGWYCVSGSGTKTNKDAKVTINGGTLTSTVDYAIYMPYAGNLIVNDGVITGGAGAISVNNGYVYINGGTLKTTGDGDTGEWSDGTSGQTPAVINLNGKYGPVNCEITGGKFIALNNAPIIISGNKYTVTVSISGGKFNQKPETQWIKDGYTITEEPDSEGFYEVVKIN